MRHLKKIIILCMFFVMVLYNPQIKAGGSQIVSAITSFLPNLKEVGFVVNLTNVYFQVSQFFRATKTVVDNMRAVKHDIKTAANNAKDIYQAISSLKNVSLYDMYTWQQATTTLYYINDLAISNPIRIYNNGYEHIVGSQYRFIKSTLSLDDYAEKRMQMYGIVKKTYVDEEYESEIIPAFQKINGSQFAQKIAVMESLYVVQSTKPIPDTIIMKRIEKEIERYDFIQANIQESIYTGKMDTVLATAMDLIATNLMQISEQEKELKNMEDSAASFIVKYEDLKNGNVKTTPLNSVISRSNTLNPIKGLYDDTDPDKAPTPKAPTGGKAKTTTKKVASSQDIMFLENEILFTLLRQDIMRKDLSAMKTNTLAYIVALEGMNQNKAVFNSNLVSAKNYMMKLRFEAEEEKRKAFK